jgi:hypothetical protein
MAGCAAQALLPGEAGRLAACAVGSAGAVEFALCAAAPQMNPELRIAAQCAASSGGEPVTFATCTGGRLTVRELGKCIGGEVGKDCFGPNNTVRKYLEELAKIYGGAAATIANDLQHGLGPNNDIRKALEAAQGLAVGVAKGVGEAVQGVGQKAAEIVSEIKNALNNPVPALKGALDNLGVKLPDKLDVRW